MLRLVNTLPDCTVANQAVEIPGPLPVRAIFMAYEVDSAALHDLTFDDLEGQTRVTVSGTRGQPSERVSCGRPQAFVTIAEAFYGRAYVENVTGGAGLLVLPIFFGLPNDDNAMFVPAEQHMTVYPPFIDATLLDSGTCTVYVFAQDGPCKYLLRYTDETRDLGGERKHPLVDEGVAFVVASGASTTDPDSFRLSRGGKEELCFGDWNTYMGVFQEMMHTDNDTTYDDLVVDPCAMGRLLHQGLGSGCAMITSGGTGNFVLTQGILDWHVGDLLSQSLAYMDDQVERSRARVRYAGAPESLLPVLAPKPSALVPGVKGAGGRPQVFPQIPGGAAEQTSRRIPTKAAATSRRIKLFGR